MNPREYQSIKATLNFATPRFFVFRHLLFDGSIWCVVLVVHTYFHHVAASAAAGLLLGVFMFRSFSMMHEAVHGILNGNSRFNFVLGWLFGTFSLLPFSSWRKVHLDHHLWTGNLDRDPTMRLILGHRDGVIPTSKVQDFFWRAWLPYLAWRQQLVFWKRSLEDRDWVVRAQTLGSLAYLAGLGLLTGGTVVVVAVFTYLMIVELINFPHHMDLKQAGGTMRLPAHEQHRFSRTCLYQKWFSRHVLLNFNFHVEHHLFPNLPWHELDKAHTHVRQALGEAYNMSSGNKWIVESRAQPLTVVMDKSINYSYSKTNSEKNEKKEPKAA